MSMLEVLIAMGLAMLMMTTLLYFYSQIDLINVELEKSQNEAFQISFLEHRLANILPKTLSSHDISKQFFFFTTGDGNGLLKEGMPSLFFSFYAGVSLDSLFCNIALGRLYLDKLGNFSLSMWPSTDRWAHLNPIPTKKEILLTDVESLSFKFYNAPDKDNELKIILEAARKSTKKGEMIFPKDSWLTEWRPEYKQLPALIKIVLKRKNVKEEMVFIYHLPNSDMLIIYDK